LSGELLTYADSEFEEFVQTPPPCGLGLSVDRLMRLVRGAADKPDENYPCKLASKRINDPIQPAAQHGGRLTKAQASNGILPRRKSRGGNSLTATLKRLKKN